MESTCENLCTYCIYCSHCTELLHIRIV